MFVNGKEIFKFRADNKNVSFPTRFCLGIISDEFSNIEPREESLNENVYDFSAGYNSTNNCEILNIHNFLLTKNNIR